MATVTIVISVLLGFTGCKGNGTQTSGTDTIPDYFTFISLTGATRNSIVTSNPAIIDGINSPTSISISGPNGSYSVNDGGYTNAAGTVSKGDTVTVRLVSSPDFNSSVTMTLVVGGIEHTFTVTTEPCVSPVIFQDNFNTYTSGWTPSDSSPAHHVAGGTLQNPGKNEPLNWTGWIRYGNASITIDPTAGRSGTPCLKIVPSWPQSQSEQVGLVKYLGANGYDELYIRYWTKFEQAYQWGNGQNGSFVFYKILRIWQGVTDSEVAGLSGNLSSELGRGAIVAGYYEDDYGIFAPYWAVGAMRNSTGQTVNCSTDGICDVFYYYPYSGASNGGHLAGHWGPINASGYFTDTQTWHCVEMHIKLASTFNGPDGIDEVWFDGEKQVDFTWVSVPGYAGVPRAQDKFPTARVGNGINYITLNDNQTGTTYWSGPHAVYYDDIVISTNYIGP